MSRSAAVHSFLLPLFLVIGVIGCGGGGGGGGGGGDGGDPTGPLMVVAMTPGDGSIDVPNSGAVTVHMNQRVNGNTVDDDTVYVTVFGSAAKVAGLIGVAPDGFRITFTPSPWYAVSTTYQIHVVAGIRSALGDDLLQDFTGRFTTGPWPSPEPVTQGMFRAVKDELTTGRSRHTSTLLPNGYVLLAGGYTDIDSTTALAELFDPDLTREAFLPAGSMIGRRANHTAVLLSDGTVLLAGGESEAGQSLATCEYYYAASSTFLSAPGMSSGRSEHTMTRLADGRVLVTGGKSYDAFGNLVPLATAEIFTPDPFGSAWIPTANNMSAGRWGHTATLLSNGQVLVTGGGFGSEHAEADLFDPALNRFVSTNGKMASPRWRHGAVELPSGRVLVTDGGEQRGELYHPSTKQFVSINSVDSKERFGAVTFQFRPGEVLILGGFQILPSGDWFLHSDMEQYVENYGDTGGYFGIPGIPQVGVYLTDNRVFSRVTELPKLTGESLHRYLITGGIGPFVESLDLATALIFNPNLR